MMWAMNENQPQTITTLAEFDPAEPLSSNTQNLRSALTEISFQSLDLEPVLLQGLHQAGLRYCTPIQAQALPRALAGGDIEGQAQTGTGKTAAFLLATMNRLLRTAPPKTSECSAPRALIVAPTRELAVQIYRDTVLLGKYTSLRFALAFGGTDYDKQRTEIAAGVDILIGTPGRLIDYLKQGVYTLRFAEVVVIDEADRMFDLGFIRDLRYLLRRMPAATGRLNMLFSATLSHRVSELAYEHMNAPLNINATPKGSSVGAERIQHSLYHIATEDKIPLLLGLLNYIAPTHAIIFFNTKRETERIGRYLKANKYTVGVLSGDVPQPKRLALLDRFRCAQLPLLLATDVAARGLHIPNVSHVFNYDLPQDPEDYVHRIGRTARVGASGVAVSLCCEQWCYSLQDIETFIGHKIPVIHVSAELLQTPIAPEPGSSPKPRPQPPRRSTSKPSYQRPN